MALAPKFAAHRLSADPAAKSVHTIELCRLTTEPESNPIHMLTIWLLQSSTMFVR